MKKLRDLDKIDQVADVGIDMSPLLDMVFLLLIFFMVTTVFVEETGVDVTKPSATSAEKVDRNSLMFAVDENGKVFYDSNEISVSQIKPIVVRKLLVKQVPVLVVADEDSHSGRLMEVIDQCKLGGAETISIAAEVE